MTDRCDATVKTSGWRARRCSRKATVTRDGRQYCAQHDPERIAAEREAQARQQADKDRKVINALMRADALALRLGVGRGVYGQSGLMLTEAEAERLADRLDRLEGRSGQ